MHAYITGGGNNQQMKEDSTIHFESIHTSSLIQLQPSQNNNVQHVTHGASEAECKIFDIHDDLMCYIISFLYGSGIGGGGACGYYEPIEELFRVLSHVSKSFRKICVQYVQRVPLDFLWASGAAGEKSLMTAYWMARHKVKVGSFIYPNQDYKCRVGGIMVEMIHAAKVLLRCCDTSKLSKVQLLPRLKGVNMKMNVPMGDLDEYTTVSIGTGVTIPDVVANPTISLLNAIATNASSIESLQCCLSMSSCAVLSRFSHSLKVVNLTLCEGTRTGAQTKDGAAIAKSKHGDLLCEAIHNMPNVENLALNVRFPMDLKIQSGSITHIDTYHSHHNVWVLECICPSLERFTCRHESNGVRPVSTLLEREVNKYEGRLDIRVDDIPFRGMQVPKDCVVFFKLLWYDLVSSGGDDLL